VNGPTDPAGSCGSTYGYNNVTRSLQELTQALYIITMLHISREMDTFNEKENTLDTKCGVCSLVFALLEIGVCSALRGEGGVI
jgi:hypothetical protein